MKGINASITKGLNHGSIVPTCDNSGAQIVKIVSVKRSKTVKKRSPSAGIGDLVFVSVKKGSKEMRKQVVPAIIVRQRREFRRPDGTRIKFMDNAVVILKDEKGNPKGTVIKGAIAKEVIQRWPLLSKITSIVV